MKKLLVSVVVVAILAVLFVAALVAPLMRLREVPRESLDVLMEAFHEHGIRNGINGPFNGVVLVADGDEVLFHQAYGVADVATGEPLTQDSRFLIGQISMQFTAMLVLQQVERGTLTLDQSVADLVLGFPEDRSREWTLHRLLSHTAGLPGDADMRFVDHGEEDDPDETMTPREFVEQITQLSPSFEVDEDHRVSTVGYVLLGIVLEELSGKSYDELLRENIVDPLGLENTGLAGNASDVVPGYRFRRANPLQTMFVAGDGTLEPAGFRDPATTFSGAGLYSTAADLLRWTQALRHGELLSAELRQRMTTPNRWGYGYGLRRNPDELFRNAPDAPLLAHEGRVTGYRAFVGMYDDGTTLIALANSGPLDLDRFTHNLYLTAKGDPPIEGPRRPSVGNLKEFDEEGGVSAFVGYYQDVSRRAEYPICPPERTLTHIVRIQLAADREADALRTVNELAELCAGFDDGLLNGPGYAFLQSERVDAALQVLRRNAELHPQVPNVHDSLGEALEANGEVEEARRSYTRAIELGTAQHDSSVSTYRRHLERLDRDRAPGPDS